MSGAVLRIVLLVAFSALGCATATPVEPGRTRISDLGYAAVVPAGWRVVGKREYAGREADMEAEISSMVTGTGGESDGAEVVELGVAQAVENVRSGRIEFLFPEHRSPESYDNINVQVLRGHLPPLGTDVSDVCDSFPTSLEAAFGREISMHRCELLPMADRASLVIESDGVYEGSRMLQFHLDHSPAKLLVITATLDARTVDSRRPEVVAFVESIAFPEP